MEFGTQDDGRTPTQLNFQCAQDQAAHAPSVLLQVPLPTSSADLPHHLLPAVPEAAATSSGEHHQQQQQHAQHRQSLFEGMDAWADTIWPHEHMGSSHTTQVLWSRVEPIEPYLGKPRPPSPSRLGTSLTTCVATAKTVCLAFVVLAMVILSVSIFYMIGDLPAATPRSTEVGAEDFPLPTAIFTDEVDFSVIIQSSPPIEEESTSEAQTNAFTYPVVRTYSRVDAQPRFHEGRAVCRRCDARVAVETVDLGKRRHDVTTTEYAHGAGLDEATQSAERAAPNGRDSRTLLTLWKYGMN